MTAIRPYFWVQHNAKVRCNMQRFKWVPGLSLSQKQKCVRNLHYAIYAGVGPCDILEVSTKSEDPLGRKLSAFNLTYKGVPMELLYQRAKCYKKVVQAPVTVPACPVEVDELVGFYFEGIFWTANDLDKSAFYDYLYCLAVKDSLSYDEIQVINDYQNFTDIAFNPKRSFNTQARACAFIKALIMCYGDIPDWESVDEFKQCHKLHVAE